MYGYCNNIFRSDCSYCSQNIKQIKKGKKGTGKVQLESHL